MSEVHRTEVTKPSWTGSATSAARAERACPNRHVVEDRNQENMRFEHDSNARTEDPQ